MIKFWICFLFLVRGFAVECQFALVHIGKEFPAYGYFAIEQIRFFNADVPIHILLEKEAIEKMKASKSAFIHAQNLHLVDVASLPLSEEHIEFRKVSRFNKTWRDGYWSHGTERFFYLYDFIKNAELEHVVHIENDTLIYIDMNELLPLFLKNHVKIAAPFQSLVGCPPCFVYIKNTDSFSPLIHFMLKMIREYRGNRPDVEVQDWVTLSSYRSIFGDEALTALPILMPEYAKYYKKRDIPTFEDNHTPLEFLSKNAQFFPGYLFDAAALGIYANGHDPRNQGAGGPGILHYKALFDPGHFQIIWGKDSQNRQTPFLIFKGKVYKVINLHLHSKMPEHFVSFSPYQQPFPKNSHL